MAVPSGALRFNSDSGKLEYYNGEAWWQIDNFSADNATGGARGLFAGGNSGPTNYNVIDYVTISTTGNAIDFGDLITAAPYRAATSSTTRALFYNAQNLTQVEYITISSTGQAAAFGDAPNDYSQVQVCSNSTRSLRAGGSDAGVTYSTIYYSTIASLGTFATFGDITPEGRLSGTGLSSSTRGIFAGGRSPSSPSSSNVIDFVTISTLGNTADFGDLTQTRRFPSGCSNSIRGLISGGDTPSANYNVIDYLTISTTGNAIDFGDLSGATTAAAATSSPIHGVFGGGYTTPSNKNVIDYVTIMSTGNAIDFGDIIVARSGLSGCSNAHGGL